MRRIDASTMTACDGSVTCPASVAVGACAFEAEAQRLTKTHKIGWRITSSWIQWIRPNNTRKTPPFALRLRTLYQGIDRHDRPMDPHPGRMVQSRRSTEMRGAPAMIAYRHVLRRSLFNLAVLGAIGAYASAGAQSITPEATVRSVQRMLERLPYYGVFDYIVFRVDGSTVYLAGYSFEGRLKADAEMAAKRARGVVEVGNKIEVLPTSQNDDRIRWATFYRIYTDDFLSRYAPGGELGVRRELRDETLFPGMQ